MKQSASKRRGGFWVGVIFLVISALFWLLIIIAATADGEPVDVGSILGLGVFITAAPIVLGILCICGRGRLVVRFITVFMALVSTVAAAVLFSIGHLWYWGLFCSIVAAIFIWVSTKFGAIWP